MPAAVIDYCVGEIERHHYLMMAVVAVVGVVALRNCRAHWMTIGVYCVADCL